MNIRDEIPIGVFDILETDISENASVVDEDVNTTESIDGCLDDLFAVDDVVVVGNGVSTGCFDFLDYQICGLWSYVNTRMETTEACDNQNSPLSLHPRP